jgi:uncharacterized protein YecE (DUF72 family)
MRGSAIQVLGEPQMAKAACDIRVGTSGWHYNHWLGRFYPDGTPRNKWLEYYARHFDTVEINNTFYHLPKEVSLRRWRDQAPANFVYTIKANRYITHIKRLKGTSEQVALFFNRVNILAETLGPILYQLPPSMHKDIERLKAFLHQLPPGRIAVFEFRHKSWFSDDTYELLATNGADFCIHDMAGTESPRVVTGDVIYVRFHGTTGRYQGNYPKSALTDWAAWIKQNLKGMRGVYAYFNNDYNAYAVDNAKTLKAALISK